MTKISRRHFEQRLIDLVLSGLDAGLPPRREDRAMRKSRHQEEIESADSEGSEES
jgi:hypothetical protein